jgi:ligand-binding sensor domain-containing protein/AraC-like DNA-binding protein
MAMALFAVAFNVDGKELYFKQIDFASSIGEENGNPTVNAFFKDSKRFVWIGGEKQLIRYDGLHSVNVPLVDGLESAGGVVAISEFANKCIVLGTNKGLYRFPDSDGKTNMEKIFSKEIESVTCLLAVDADRVLVGTNRGIKLVNIANKSVKELPISSNLLDNSNSVIGMSRLKDAVYVLTKGGVYCLNLSKLSYDDIANYKVNGIAQTSIVATPGKLYIGTMGKGVIPYNLKTHQPEAALAIGATVVTSVVADKEYKNLYVGTDGSGVFQLSLPDEKLITHYNHQPYNSNSLHNNQVRALMQDDHNSLWIGYYQNGVDYMLDNTGLFSVFNREEYMNSRGVAVRAMDASSSDVALGTREGLIYLNFLKHSMSRLNSSKLRSDMVLSLLRDGNKLYVGTYGGGLSVVDMTTMAVAPFAGNGDETFTNGHIFSIARQADNSLWLGTNTGVYHVVNNLIVGHYTSGNSKLPEGNVYAVFFDSQNKGWFCTESGICIYDPAHKELRTDIFPESFPRTKRVHTVYEDSKHRLYFLPEKGKAFRTTLDMKNLVEIDPDQTQGIEFKGVVEDRQGSIWFASNNGVYRQDVKGRWYHYGFADGIPSQVFLQCHPALDIYGNVWFGNSDGLLRCDIQMLASYKTKHFGIFPVGIQADGKPQSVMIVDDYHVEFSERYSTVTINFSTFSYSLDDARDYEYSLDGDDWQPIHSDFSITMNDMGGGSHSLLVRHKGQAETEVEITMDMPYHWIGKLMFALVGLVLIMGIYIVWHQLYIRARIRQRRQADAQAEAERLAKEEELSHRKKYTANHISDEKCAEIVQRIEAAMKSEKPYLNSDMKIADLAALTDVSSHKLSYIFSQYMNVTFYDYINRFRVDEFKQIVAKQGVDSLTLSALAEKAGFSSRASFFRYFKEIEGISPGEYIKTLPK